MKRLLARKNILDLKAYEPGKPIKELERELGIAEADIIKLASNENPIGPSPKALKAILKEAKGINRYPDGNSYYLKKKLAAKLKLAPGNLVLGNGSDELIDIITKTFLEEDEEALIAAPSFLEYEIIVRARGARLKTIPMVGPLAAKKEASVRCFRYDAERITKSVGRKTRVIFLGNPDNPTGAYITKRQMKLLLTKIPRDVIVVFDEAYREFVSEPDYSNPRDYIERKNIIIIRTFSKAYGLAGLRIGYAISDSKIAGWMDRARQPFNINLLAQVAAEAALDDREHLSKTRRLIKEGRGFLLDGLKKIGCDIIRGPANFMLFSYKGKTGTEIFRKLLPYGVIIRDMKAYGLDRWARVNVGRMPENRRFVNALKKVLGKNPQEV